MSTPLTTTRLTEPPRLPAVLARGALTSPAKRGPYEGSELPRERLVLPEAATDQRRLRSYAQVCGYPEPARGEPLPPAWPHILGFPLAMQLMAGRGFPFPLLGLVHTGVELTQERALCAEERPEIAVYAEDLRPHRRGTQFTVVTEARLADGPVWRSRSDYLCRHRRPDGDRETGTTAGGREQRGAQQPAALPPGDEWALPASLGRRYAAASGDRNPIHLHPLTAKLFGFPRHIAHGMWTFARALAATGVNTRGQLTVRAEFKAPLLLPSRAVFGCEEAPAGTSGSPAHRFEVRSGGDASGDGGRLHLTGEVTSALPPSAGRDPSSRSS